jgi:hypothetical protein
VTDILNQRAPRATPPRPHPVIDAIIAAGRAATELRNRHHAEGEPLRHQVAEARIAAQPGGTA